MCLHLKHNATVNIHRLTDGEPGPNVAVIGYTAEVKIRCAECDEEFVFIGMPCGSSPTEPMVSVDGAEARLPIKPKSMDHESLLSVISKQPGFKVRQQN